MWENYNSSFELQCYLKLTQVFPLVYVNTYQGNNCIMTVDVITVFIETNKRKEKRKITLNTTDLAS